MLLAQLRDGRDFVVGEQVAARLVDADGTRDMIHGALIVAAQHDDLGNAHRVERGDGVFGLGANFVAHRHDAHDDAAFARVRAVSHDDDGLAALLDFGQTSFQLGSADAQLVGEPVIADEAGPPVDRGVGAPAELRLVVVGFGRADLFLLGVGDDGLCQGMGGIFVDGGGDAHDFVGGGGRERRDIGDARFSLGDGAGFVHGERAEFRERFEVGTALDEHAAPGERGESGDDAHGSRDDQRAGTGDDEQDAGAVEPYVPFAAEKKRRHQKDEQGRKGDDGRVVAGKRIDEALGRGLLRLGLFDQADDLGECGVAGGLGDLDFEGALAVDGAGKDGRAGGFFHRHGFTGNGGLVHGGFAACDDAIQWDALTGLHGDSRAEGDLADGAFGKAAVFLANSRSVGRKFEEGARGAVGASVGPALQPFGDAEEKNHRGGFGPLADEGGANDGDDHQERDVGPEFSQCAPCAGKQKPASRHDGDGEQGGLNRGGSHVRPTQQQACADQDTGQRETTAFPTAAVAMIATARTVIVRRGGLLIAGVFVRGAHGFGSLRQTIRLVRIADAGVFRLLALAAGGEVQIDAEVLRLGVRAGAGLHDDAIRLARRQGGLGDEAGGGLLHFELCFTAGRFGDHGNRLRTGIGGLEGGVVERDLDLAFRRDEELGLEGFGFKKPSAFGTGDDGFGMEGDGGAKRGHC